MINLNKSILFKSIALQLTVRMDIQNPSTPPKANLYITPPHSTSRNQDFTTPPKNVSFQTPKRQINCTPQRKSSARRPLEKKSNLSGESSAKPNPQSKRRQMTGRKSNSPLCQQLEEYEVSMFTLSRLQQDYSLVHMLGSGNFSQVGLYRSRLSLQLVAIKETPANRMSINEVQALGSLWALAEQCPNIVRYYHSWVEGGELYLVMEYCQNSLQKLIERHRAANRPFDEKVIKKYLKAALLGIQCLHKYGIVHLDLKPENMLIKEETLKIADFGLSRASKLRSGQIEEGDSRYLAKQVLNYSKDINLTKADIFSLAMTIYQMLTLEVLPNNGEIWMNFRDQGLKVVDRMDLTNYSKSLLQLVEAMGRSSWQNRPSAEQCLRSPILYQSNRVNNFLSHLARSSKKNDNSL